MRVAVLAALLTTTVVAGADERASAEPHARAGAGAGAVPAPVTAPDAEVIVEGDAPTRELSDPTPATFVLSGDQLVVPGRSAADTLATATGVQVTRRGSAADLATLSLRGSTNAQAPIYLAGMRLNDELTGTVDLSTLPMWMFHRVEIYRGHAPHLGG